MKTVKIFHLMALLVLSISLMTILPSCGDDDDGSSPNPNPNDDITGQTIAINNQKWYVSNQSSMFVSNINDKNIPLSIVYLWFSKEKEGNQGYTYLSLSLDEVFTPEYYKPGETLNTVLQQGQIMLDNVTSYNLSYQSGRIIYQGYDAENSLIILQLDNVIYSYSGTKQLVVDGIVKIKYDINGGSDVISVNNQKWYLDFSLIANNIYADCHSLTINIFRWTNKRELSQINLIWYKIDGMFKPGNMSIGDIIDIGSSNFISDSQVYEKGDMSRSLSLESGTITYQGYDSAKKEVLLKLNNLTFDFTFSSEENDSFVLDGIVKVKFNN